jgi:hypothetical protein
MTIPGGLAHNTTHVVCCNFLATPSVLGAPASLIGSEFSQSTWLRPFDPPRPDTARLPLHETSQNGGAPNLRSPSPSLQLSKYKPSVKKSSIWARKKCLIWGMCSEPSQYYNLVNRQAGCPLNLPPPRAARLFCCLWRRYWALWTG